MCLHLIHLMYMLSSGSLRDDLRTDGTQQGMPTILARSPY